MMDPQDPDTYLTAVHAPRPSPAVDETGLALDVDGLTVRARPVRPDGPSRAAVLLVHGWTSSAGLHDLDVARDLARSGLTALAVDLPGHGRSDGVRDEVTLATFVAAVVAAHDALRDAAGEVPVLAVGSSFGGYLCARLAGERALHAVALRVPANYPEPAERLTHVVLAGAPHVIYTVPAIRVAADDLVATWVREHTGVLAHIG